MTARRSSKRAPVPRRPTRRALNEAASEMLRLLSRVLPPSGFWPWLGAGSMEWQDEVRPLLARLGVTEREPSASEVAYAARPEWQRWFDECVEEARAELDAERAQPAPSSDGGEP